MRIMRITHPSSYPTAKHTRSHLLPLHAANAKASRFPSLNHGPLNLTLNFFLSLTLKFSRRLKPNADVVTSLSARPNEFKVFKLCNFLLQHRSELISACHSPKQIKPTVLPTPNLKCKEETSTLDHSLR